MTVFCAVVLLYTLFSSFVQCSGIITKSMIRMPNGSSYGFSRPMTPGSQLPKPEMLTSRPSHSELQALHPFNPEGVRNMSVESLSFNQNTSFETPIAEHFVQLLPPKPLANTTTPISETHDSSVPEMKHNTVLPDGFTIVKEEIAYLNTTPKELSSKYWMKYNNFSHDFFNKFSVQENPKYESKVDTRYPESILEVVERIFSCFWSSEVFSCVQDGLGDSSLESFSFFHLVSPRVSRFQSEDEEEERSTSRDNGFGNSIVEEDEGRKRLSKRLIQLIPFLLTLKMTMLPALAVMALVSGKAFLMSLLSLGVALVATFSSAVPFRADKRQEIGPQTPGSSSRLPEQIPGKYYYVM